MAALRLTTESFAISHCGGCDEGDEKLTALGVAVCRWSRPHGNY